MSLILPPWYFAKQTNNLAVSTTPGTNFTANASSADGASVSVLSALGHDVHLLIAKISGLQVSTGNSSALLDILSDPAGGTSWGALIDDLVCGFLTGSVDVSAGSHTYVFPIYIKAGTSLGVRARTAHSANLTGGRVLLFAFGEPSRPDMWWCGQKVESLGLNPGTSEGTEITPGVSGAFGSWTNVGSVTSQRYGAVCLGVNGSDATAVANAALWQLGYGSNRVPGISDYYSNMGTTENASRGCPIIPFCDVPAGTQMQVRGSVSSGTAEDYNVGVYGVY
jgi:hypothetical protein